MKRTLEDMALDLGLGGTLVPYQIWPHSYGYEFRKNKGPADLVKARRKAFSTPPFKTEMHLSLLEVYLKDIVKKTKANQ